MPGHRATDPAVCHMMHVENQCLPACGVPGRFLSPPPRTRATQIKRFVRWSQHTNHVLEQLCAGKETPGFRQLRIIHRGEQRSPLRLGQTAPAPEAKPHPSISTILKQKLVFVEPLVELYRGHGIRGPSGRITAFAGSFVRNRIHVGPPMFSVLQGGIHPTAGDGQMRAELRHMICTPRTGAPDGEPVMILRRFGMRRQITPSRHAAEVPARCRSSERHSPRCVGNS